MEGINEVMSINIENCNCIKSANININTNSLNIKYGLNGTGKSTISKAILYFSNQDNDSLSNLRPYNSDVDPKIKNCKFKKVRLFDENYVNKYLFENDSFLNNSYQVFLRDKELDKMRENTENLLKSLKNIFEESEELNDLMNFLPSYRNITNFDNGNISKRGGLGELLKGNGSGFDNHEELNSYKPFYENRDFSDVSKWAKWRNDGIKQMNGESCPFCTHNMNLESIEKQNKTISTVFKNSALKTANEVLDFLQNAVEKGYIKQSSVKILEKYIGDSSKSNELIAEMNQMGIETEYLYVKIKQLFKFNPMNVSREQLEDIESQLDNFIIDNRQISKFYTTEKIKSLIKGINEKIDELRDKTSAIKTLFLKCQQKMEDLIKDRRGDINDFFAIAGFPYKFILKNNGENNAICYLIPSNADEIDKIENPQNHLSWGEKNAFSLVMFMFEVANDDVDLIILDDPITSFDKNKKFAVTKRLFDNKEFSFKNKTVLMLTHDLQPVIDYVQGKFLRRYDIHTPVYATYLVNNDGNLEEKEITKSDLKNVVELTRSIALENSYDIAIRIINLRKFIELTTPDFIEDSAYDVLSNLIHGRQLDKYESRIVYKNKSDFISKGMAFINGFIPEMNYNDLLDETSDYKLLQLVKNENIYTQIIAIRFLFEKDRESGTLMSQLKKEYPNVCKFVNETNHIENDYIFQLNPIEFFEIPLSYLNQLKIFCNEKLTS
jgi:hypothetical protein